MSDIHKALEEIMKRVENTTSENDFQFPLTITSIKRLTNAGVRAQPLCETGSLVQIRPCGKEYDGKTFLGIMLGDFIVDTILTMDKDGSELAILHHRNPGIFVPELKRVIFGMESWWGKIEDPSQLQEITDESIRNLWYVKALKAMLEEEDPDEHK
jgi:hypothetical protein